MKEHKHDKIKICHFVNKITGREDGVLNHILAQIKLLSEFEQIIIYQGEKDVERIVNKFNVKYCSLECLNKKYSLKVFIQFYKIITSEDVDIIIAHKIKPYVIAGLLNIFLRRKLIYNYHGSFIKNDYNTKTEQLIYKILHWLISLFNNVYVVTPSKTSSILLVNETKLFKKITAYYNGYCKLSEDDKSDVSIINELTKLKTKYFLIGYVGRLNREKNVFRALEIIDILNKNKMNVFLVIFGSGEDEDKLKKYISLKTIQNIKLYGYLYNASSYMKYFDLLLITSNREGLPLIVWEAMYNQIPVISSDVGGIKEILEQENCGLVFKNDINDAVQKIILLMNDKQLHRKFGENGFNAIMNKYNENNFRIFFEDYYHDIINEKRIKHTSHFAIF
ncbi:glycosyltransferase [Rosettibacter firmus]|uniref:glycosyltransferase n=1 Tax=Rosettibacter firmus TaxID=3111522 RepID=UPI00336BD530